MKKLLLAFAALSLLATTIIPASAQYRTTCRTNCAFGQCTTVCS